MMWISIDFRKSTDVDRGHRASQANRIKNSQHHGPHLARHAAGGRAGPARHAPDGLDAHEHLPDLHHQRQGGGAGAASYQSRGGGIFFLWGLRARTHGAAAAACCARRRRAGERRSETRGPGASGRAASHGERVARENGLGPKTHRGRPRPRHCVRRRRERHAHAQTTTHQRRRPSPSSTSASRTRRLKVDASTTAGR